MNPVIFNCFFQFHQEQLLQNGKEEDISTITLKGNLPSIVTCRFRHVYRRRDFSGFKNNSRSIGFRVSGFTGVYMCQ